MYFSIFVRQSNFRSPFFQGQQQWYLDEVLGPGNELQNKWWAKWIIKMVFLKHQISEVWNLQAFLTVQNQNFKKLQGNLPMLFITGFSILHFVDFRYRIQTTVWTINWIALMKYLKINSRYLHMLAGTEIICSELENLPYTSKIKVNRWKSNAASQWYQQQGSVLKKKNKCEINCSK